MKMMVVRALVLATAMAMLMMGCTITIGPPYGLQSGIRGHFGPTSYGYRGSYGGYYGGQGSYGGYGYGGYPSYGYYGGHGYRGHGR